MAVLTIVSGYFNVSLGLLLATAGTLTVLFLPLAFLFLDFAMVGQIICLMSGRIQNGFIWVVTLLLSGVLLCLSLFAGLTMIVAMDTISKNKGEYMAYWAAEELVISKKKQVETWREKQETTDVYPTEYQKRLNKVEKDLKRVTEDFRKMDAPPPAHLVVFEKLVDASPKKWKWTKDGLELFTRAVWTSAIVITSLWIGILLSHIILSEGRKPKDTKKKPETKAQNNEDQEDPKTTRLAA
jgi:hypothetical protein